jgi:chromate transporter
LSGPVHWPDIWALFGIMGQLSFLAIGGMNPVLPEMQRQVTEVHHWMTPHDFAALFALAQAAPGPNFLVTTLVGWRVAGVPGALSATLGILTPPCILSYWMGALWHRFRHATWRQVVQAGLTPVTCGLVMAAAALLARSTVHGIGTLVVLALSTAILLTTKVHPLAVLGTAALAGAVGLIG